MGTFVLQMGHVPRTRGATGAPGEQAYNRAVCAMAADLLRADRHTVHVIPADPLTYPTGDVFVAVHYDGSVNPNARGASVGYRNAAGRVEAHKWKAAYQRLGFTGGFRADNYTAGLSGYYGTGRSRTRASYILEGGFGSHPVEGPWLRSPEGISTCARAIHMALTGHNPPPKEEPVTPAQIEAVARRTVDLIHREGLTPRTKEDQAKRVWDHSIHPTDDNPWPARNRLRDVYVLCRQIKRTLERHTEFDVPEPEES